MGGRNCCVKNCRRRSHDHHGRKIPNGLSIHCFPAWRQSEGAQTSELTRRRREAWVAAVGRSDITFDHVPASMRVCSRHFHSGNPAYEMLESDPDWVPSLHLGHGEGNGRRSKRFPPPEQSKVERRQRWTTERRHEARTTHRELGGGGTQDSLQTTDAARPTAPPWREVKSLLQSVLQSKTNETDDCAAAKEEEDGAQLQKEKISLGHL
ncbi:uncharacterized protein AKAME5_001354200 [Lates japonicus]|uniref:THAP-type domain-containing protein n=1 Tax=Lates japonicus TaxID=270547 RepID=A0AAD3MXY9_LATJO|nr:uncharacterized protein AKAME5_001354200 [Lates japonicus]